ncbi:LysR family transcriptional regulator [Salmonella enterica subsp. enterica serovar Saintpaul]|nr:LysR family transcriptional regulator [Salmonella enterica subsp. enterica serovar Saintpaul]
MLQNNFSKVIRSDINLLVTLYFLLKNRQVSKTAKQLYIGQSAVSHQLNRLREMFDDQLLVRTAAGMMLTPFAERIYPTLERVVTDLEVLLKKKNQHQHPHPMKDIYRICVPEDVYIEDISVLFYDFAHNENIRENVTFEVFNRYDLCISDLNEGKIDFFFGASDNLSCNIISSELLETEFCLAVRSDHPLANKTVPLDVIAQYPWVDILFREKVNSFSNELWGEAINNMNCVLKTSSANAAIALLRHSDALCSLSEDIIHKHGLAQVKTKEKINIMNYLYWHKIMENDDFHRYIREGLLSKYVSENVSVDK